MINNQVNGDIPVGHRTSLPAGSESGMPTSPKPGMPGGPGVPPVQSNSSSNIAMASIVLSLTGLLCGFPAIAGLVLGLYELNRIKSRQSSPQGKNLAIAGVIIGALITVSLFIAFIVAFAHNL